MHFISNLNCGTIWKSIILEKAFENGQKEDRNSDLFEGKDQPYHVTTHSRLGQGATRKHRGLLHRLVQETWYYMSLFRRNH
jgi:hypothetical protein